MGERTPHLDATARGGWIGLTARHTRADLIRAVIEGVSYSQSDCLDIIEGLGVPVDSVRVSGGGRESPFWRQLLADILDKRVVTLETQEGSAYGAALLALVGTGEYASVPEVCRAADPRSRSSDLPDAAEAQAYPKAAPRLSGALPGAQAHLRDRSNNRSCTPTSACRSRSTSSSRTPCRKPCGIVSKRAAASSFPSAAVS